MSVIKFENKEARVKREIQEFGEWIGRETAKNFHYDPDSDPVLADFRRKMGL